ncbi:putative zinc-binding peptidase [Algoriphagus aestuariicola]|uniref:Zinc-binding peptidase n=1 Tax=Algoriphagus aestuariicola TaxID=1852016 RepID=A0ABS3BMN3_9BACT|nr:putative zinc-binding peptidase [Algoriphagus aestuariicola]MBN7800553.1 putative zinc-binding peptidase [Algoriphagus aestuariicola]
MKLFECANCSNPLFFENTYCEKCGHQCGFSVTALDMLTFRPERIPMISDKSRRAYKYCKNLEFGVCNWLIPADRSDEFCIACALNRTIPDLSDSENTAKWRKLEVAKHRLVYQLARLGLPLSSKMLVPEGGLCFDFISKTNDSKVMTGHADGVVTILLSEADSVHREQIRTQLSEVYRTLIGHFRHEVGHYYWDQLVAGREQAQSSFRNVFGDERTNYGESLSRYYEQGAAADWQNSHISAYASAHPWEDWAETWAHYLHILDMAETAYYFGLSVRPKVKSKILRGTIETDPYSISKFEKIFHAWMPVSFTINSLNRSMGVPDAYPFVVSPAVLEKMNTIHRLIKR